MLFLILNFVHVYNNTINHTTRFLLQRSNLNYASNGSLTTLSTFIFQMKLQNNFIYVQMKKNRLTIALVSAWKQSTHFVHTQSSLEHGEPYTAECSSQENVVLILILKMSDAFNQSVSLQANCIQLYGYNFDC